MSGVDGLGTISGTEKMSLTDRAFAGLPIPGVKKSVTEITSNKNARETLDKILSGEISLKSPAKTGRYIEKASGYYIYTVLLSDNTQMDAVFYSHTNKKILVKIGNEFIELDEGQKDTILKDLSALYTLPVYTQDGIGGVRLLASN